MIGPGSDKKKQCARYLLLEIQNNLRSYVLWPGGRFRLFCGSGPGGNKWTTAQKKCWFLLPFPSFNKIEDIQNQGGRSWAGARGAKIDFNALQEVENRLEWEQWWASEWEPSYEPNCLLDANQRQKQVFPLRMPIYNLHTFAQIRFQHCAFNHISKFYGEGKNSKILILSHL